MSSVECQLNSPETFGLWLFMVAIIGLILIGDWMIERRNAKGERIVAELLDHSLILEGLLAQLDRRKAEVEALDRREP